mmetsp:Transcript_168916/g.543020  ORF Transcript_168916/g.543020 Transcript_168916/m.543020 type:complete len:207 (-) Transcript_168916:907-1527(-)
MGRREQRLQHRRRRVCLWGRRRRSGGTWEPKRGSEGWLLQGSRRRPAECSSSPGPLPSPSGRLLLLRRGRRQSKTCGGASAERRRLRAALRRGLPGHQVRLLVPADQPAKPWPGRRGPEPGALCGLCAGADLRRGCGRGRPSSQKLQEVEDRAVVQTCACRSCHLGHLEVFAAVPELGGLLRPRPGARAARRRARCGHGAGGGYFS